MLAQAGWMSSYFLANRPPTGGVHAKQAVEYGLSYQQAVACLFKIFAAGICIQACGQFIHSGQGMHENHIWPGQLHEFQADAIVADLLQESHILNAFFLHSGHINHINILDAAMEICVPHIPGLGQIWGH